MFFLVLDFLSPSLKICHIKWIDQDGVADNDDDDRHDDDDEGQDDLVEWVDQEGVLLLSGLHCLLIRCVPVLPPNNHL